MTVAEAIRLATERLAQTSQTARLDAELLMAHALEVSRSDMLLRYMGDPAPSGFAMLVERRTTCEPVAHILGEQEFFGLTFKVSPDVLIPRADSELLVEAALEVAGDTGRVADLGTGSGALLLTFLTKMPKWQGIGIDASLPALAIAKENSERFGLNGRANLLLRDWNEAGWEADLGQFDLILCNPPYVELDARLEPDVRRFEPAEALFGGAEGLDDYRILIPQLPLILARNGTAIFEIGHKQGPAVSEISASHGFYCKIFRDLGERPRATILTRGVGKGSESV